MSATAVLLTVGAFLELVGIVLVGSNDLIPYRDRLNRWLLVRIVSPFFRLIGRPRTQRISAGVALSSAVSLGASATTSVRDDASLEQKVAFLLRRDQEAQRLENELSGQLTTLERETEKRLDELREGMELHVSSSLTAAHERYLPLRLFGVLLLALGLGCVTASGFV